MAKKRKRYLGLLTELERQENLSVVKEDDKVVEQSPETGKIMLPTERLNTTVPKTTTSTKKTTTTKTEEKDDTSGWLQKGALSAFDDGYDFGDITKTILGGTLGTVADVGVGAVKGLGNIAEGLADLITYGSAGVIDAFGNDDYADRLRERVQENTIDKWFEPAKDYVDQYSFIGDKGDQISEGLGYIGGIMATGGLGELAGLGTVGTTLLTSGMIGASSMGSGMSEAYQGGATDDEAVKYGIISGVVEAGTELIFGGLGKAVNAVGLSKGISSLDDALAKKISSKLSSQLSKNLAEYTVKAGAEGAEEVIAGFLNSIGKEMTYMSEQDWVDTLKDEKLLEQFIVGAVTSGIAQAPGLVKATKAGRDYITNRTQQEQQVIDAEVESRVQEQQEATGKELSNKEITKIMEQVESDLEKGYISTEAIENTLLAKDNAEIAALQERLAQETDPKARTDIETLITMNELNRQTNLEKMLENNGLLQESYLEQGRKSQAFEYDTNEKLSEQRKSIYADAQDLKLNNTRRTHETLDMIAKVAEDRGTKYRIVNSEKLKELGFIETANGLVTNEGEVLINLDSKKALNAVVGHETTHLLEGSEDSEALQKFAMEYAKAKGEYETRLQSINSLYKGTNANVYNELTADIVGDYLFTDEKFINNLSTEQPNVFKKIYNYIKHLYKMATAGSTEARQLEQLKHSFEKAYKNASKQADATKYSLTNAEQGAINDWVGANSYIINERLRNGQELSPKLQKTADNLSSFIKTLPVVEGTVYRSIPLSGEKLNEFLSRYKQGAIVEEKAFTSAGINQVYDDSMNIQMEIISHTARDTSNLMRPGEKEVLFDRNSKFKVLEVNATDLNNIKIIAEDVSNSETKYSLTDNQGRTLTKQQQEYFKDSKVRDEQGNLLTMYHSTNAEFNEYDISKSGKNYKGWSEYGAGFYFSPNEPSAKLWGENARLPGKALIKEQYLNIANPFRVYGKNVNDVELLVKEIEDKYNEKHKPYSTLKLSDEVRASGGRLLDYMRDHLAYTNSQIRELLKKHGFDGIDALEFDEKGIVKGQMVAFDSNQIKNVDNLNPTDDPDIRYSLTPDYGMTHRPSTDYGDASNFEENMPDVFEHPEWYRFGGDEWYKKAYYESLNALRKVRGNPDGEITIYRATIGDGFNEGDWVSPSKTYAENHNNAYLDGKGKVIELKVKAKDIRFAGDDLNEFGYFPNGVDDYSLSEPNVAPTGSYNVYGKDLKQQVEEAIAPLQETITELTEQVETLQEQLVEQPTTMQEEIENLINLRDNSSGSEYASAFFDLRKKYGATKLYKALNNFYNGRPVETDTDAPLNVMNKEHTPDSYTDEDVAPIAEDTTPEATESTGKVESPFDNRDIDEVGKRNIKAYMYENPEVKPFFQQEAQYMLNDLKNSIKGERIYIPELAYLEGIADQHGGFGWTGTKRQTTDDIAYLKDKYGYSYNQIEEGLKKIIEDDGKENNAVSKRIEFMLDERLKDGYVDVSGVPIPANQDYIKLLEEKAITEYHSNRFKNMTDEELLQMVQGANAETFAEETTPDIPTIQKVPKTTPQAQIKPTVKEQPKAVEPKAQKQVEQKPIKEKPRAEILIDEPAVENRRNKRGLSILASNVLDKGLVFENLALKTGNRELQGKWDYTRTAMARAQHVIGEGHTRRGVKLTKSLNEIREEIENTGYTKPFYEYMYHQLNIDRMTLEERYALKNKPVFGEDVTAAQSQEIVKKLEVAYPEFKQWAEDVYEYVNADRQQLVDNGVISQETADYWSKMYPHYVPIRRADKNGNAINVPLDTGRTGINAPIKKATGGSANILPMFDTIAMRTLQTYRATSRNSFGMELMRTLDSVPQRETANIDEVMDSIDTQEELLQEGKNGNKPTFTVFDNGEKVTFEITEDMYDALKPLSDSSILSKTSKTLNTANNIRRGLLTEYNPIFMLKNAAKDAQDVLLNSQHATRTYATLPQAYTEMTTKGKWYQEYIENGGQQNSYFDSQDNKFIQEKKGITNMLPLKAISKMNNFIEMAPRLAEYIASREAGASIETAMLDAARVTTNFKAGGDLTKFLNRNGFTFLNASVQGAMQQVRNVREAHANGLRGWANLVTKYAIAGVPVMILNSLLWEDDEEYEELSDYVKQNYYIVGKNEDGTFIRIPKGRAVAVIQEALNQMNNLVTGDDEVDLKSFLDLVINNLAPNNPLDNNIFSPIVQAGTNTAWYGGDLVPLRLQDLPAAEQYDESTDSFSKWLGELLNVSPYKINYVLDQYSGAVGDLILPMLTPEAENGSDSLLGDILAPLNDQFTTNSTLNNQNITDFYDLSDELTTGAKKSNATDADVLMNKYVNSVKSEMNELYKQKREIQNSDLSDSEKYQAVLDVQRQINELAKEALSGYENVKVQEHYAKVEDREYRINNNGEWTKITDDQLEKQYDVMNNLGITANDYWSNKEEYDFAYENPERYAVATALGDYETYKGYTSDLYDLKADKDENGKSINGSRKEKVIEYVNSLDIDYGQRLILFKSEYNADDTYNQDIIDYLNEREDISYEQMKAILTELGFTVTDDGGIYWD